MKIELNVNSVILEKEIKPGTTLLEVLRQAGYFGSKDAKCKSG
jgi:aerobic-type carbon monoxide dehydrogenase small subunit (CoxS/CutS family)